MMETLGAVRMKRTGLAGGSGVRPHAKDSIRGWREKWKGKNWVAGKKLKTFLLGGGERRLKKKGGRRRSGKDPDS